jgi:hypothetical protein
MGDRYKQFGDLGLQDRSSTPLRQPTATDGTTIARIEQMRRDHKWSASRIEFELAQEHVSISRRAVTRVSAHLGLQRRTFIDQTGESNCEPQRIIAERPGHMVHVDVKKVGRIPNGGGWRVRGRDSAHARAVGREKRWDTRPSYVYLHSAIDGYTPLGLHRSSERREGHDRCGLP